MLKNKVCWGGDVSECGPEATCVVDEAQEVWNAFAVAEEEGDGGGYVSRCGVEDSPSIIVVGAEDKEVEEGFRDAVSAVGAFGGFNTVDTVENGVKGDVARTQLRE